MNELTSKYSDALSAINKVRTEICFLLNAEIKPTDIVFEYMNDAQRLLTDIYVISLIRIKDNEHSK